MYTLRQILKPIGWMIVGMSLLMSGLFIYEKLNPKPQEAPLPPSAYADIPEAIAPDVVPRGRGVVYTGPPVYGVRSGRPIFPYAVIPGGVYSGSELAVRMAADPIIAKHFEDVDPLKFQPMKVTESFKAFVSYRKGNQVFWTRRQLNITLGETLLTDGVNMIRAKCGNRILVKKPTPLGYEEAVPPPDIVFDTPLTYVPPEIPHQPPPTPPPTPPPSPVVPEPATIFLVGTGVAALGGFARRKRGDRDAKR